MRGRKEKEADQEKEDLGTEVEVDLEIVSADGDVMILTVEMMIVLMDKPDGIEIGIGVVVQIDEDGMTTEGIVSETETVEDGVKAEAPRQ